MGGHRLPWGGGGTRDTRQGPRSHRAPGTSPTRGQRLALREPPCGPGGGPRLGEQPRQAPGPQPSNRTRRTSDGRKAPGRAEPGGPGSAGGQLPLAAPAAPGTGGCHRLAQAAAGQHAALGELVTAQVSCREGRKGLGSAQGQVRELPRAPAWVTGLSEDETGREGSPARSHDG